MDDAKLDVAFQRFDKALEGLEATIVKFRQSSETRAGLEAQLADLGEDRSKLAQELDAANAANTALNETKAHVSQRLGAVMDNIRLLLSGV